MKLNIPFKDFINTLTDYKDMLGKFADREINSVEEYNTLNREYQSLKKDCIEFIKNNASIEIYTELAGTIQGESTYSFSSQVNDNNLFESLKLLMQKIENKDRDIDGIIEYLKIADPLVQNKSFKDERANFSIEQKQNFLIEKLYRLRRYEGNYWNAKTIFNFNEVQLDDQYEAREIIQFMSKLGVVEEVGYGDGGSAKITMYGKDYVEKHLLPKPLKEKVAVGNAPTLDIFISHSQKDDSLAKALTELLMLSLKLDSNKIRCTSVDGFRFPAGASIDETIKGEVHSCKVFIALLSKQSIESTYVMFEMGARWGISKPLIPLVTSKDPQELLQGPLTQLNALSIQNASQIHQLVSDISDTLKIQPEKASVYQSRIDDLVLLSKQQ